jgi:multiple sugar transport system permease protein
VTASTTTERGTGTSTGTPLKPPGPRKPRPRRKKLREYGRPGELIVRYLLLIGVLLITVGPMVWQGLSSLKSKSEAVFGAGASIIPKDPSLDSYRRLLDQIPVGDYILNSTFIVAISLISQLLFATVAGYMLSKPSWRGAKAVMLLLVVSLMFPFESIMVSLFVSIRDMNLVDTLPGVWLPGAVGAINVLIMRAAFLAIPREIEDAAMLDGANEWQRFRLLHMPAVGGALAVVAINTFISAWDDFLWPLIVLRSEENFTLTLGLARLQSSMGFDERVVMAGSMLSVIPVLILFVLTQRWFYRGVAAGAVKM